MFVQNWLGHASARYEEATITKPCNRSMIVSSRYSCGKSNEIKHSMPRVKGHIYILRLAIARALSALSSRRVAPLHRNNLRELGAPLCTE